MPGTKELQLTNTDKTVLLDADDYEYINSLGVWYMNDSGYAVRRINGKTTRMHRLINKTPVGKVTDHLNGNRLDNRKSNLRTCTQKENANNKKNILGYTWDKSKQRYIVRYKNKFYGRYDTEKEAKRAYQLAKSGVPYQKTRRKYWHLPKGISKQFGKYRVRPQANGERYWLGQFATLEKAVEVLNKWQEKRG